MSDRDDRLDGLLARGRLAGPVRERVLQAVLREGRATRPWYAHRLLAIASPAFAAAAVVAVALTLRPSGRDMRSKGSASRSAPHVSLECTRGTGDVCSREGMLLFLVQGIRQRSYMAAFAVPRGGGERIWFFPSGPGSVEPLIEPDAAPQLLRQGVKLASVPEGTYEVRVVLGSRAISEDQAIAPADAGLTVETLSLSVAP
jgi:hypothetical protein